MKRMLMTLCAVALLAGLAGCCHGHNRYLASCRADWNRLMDSLCNCPLDRNGACCGAICDCPPGCPVCGGRGCDGGCPTCIERGCLRGGCSGPVVEGFTPGPSSAAVTYPYYTTRGPRDFLAENPPSIGP
jgi:hypothetical protein